MFSKKKRVDKELFNRIMKEGRVVSSPLFTFRYIGLGGNELHLAIVAPKAVAKQATKRNTLRRKGYSILRSFSPNSGAGIFFYKKPALEAKSLEIKEDIGILLKKADFI